MKSHTIKLNVMANSSMEDECNSMAGDMSTFMHYCSATKDRECKIAKQKLKGYVSRVVEMGPGALHVKPCLELVSGPWAA